MINSYSNLQIILISLLPISLISGPAIPDIIICISGLIFIIKTLYLREFKIFKNYLFIFLIFFYFYLIINSLLSSNILLSFESSLFYFRFIIFALAVSSLENKFKKLIFFLTISSLISFSILIVDSYYQYLNGVNLTGLLYDGDRLSSLFGEEKKLGSYISRLTPIFLGFILYLYHDSKRIILLSLLYLLLLDVLVLLSGERSSIFYIFFSTLLILILISRWKIYRLVAFLGSLIISVVILISNQQVQDRVINKTLSQLNLFGDKINFFSIQHQVIYSTSIKIFVDNPIKGVGPKNFREICKIEKYKTYNINDQSINGCQSHPHNTYIQLLTETGILGLLFILTLFFYIIRLFLYQFYYYCIF